MKKLLSALLASTILVSSAPLASATNDLVNHWGEPYIHYLSDLGVMKPSNDGSYKPSQKVMRAEFMRYLNRAFHFTEQAKESFIDVPEVDVHGNPVWYYEPVEVAVAHGYINGVGKGRMDPFGNITREQAATIIGRLHKIQPKGNVQKLAFKDKQKISAWSAGYIAEAVEAGYIVGYADGSFRPQDTITRAEFAKILYHYMGTSLDQKGATYHATNLQPNVKNASIVAGCTLSDAEIKGDLYITEGVLDEAVTLSNVKIDGTLIISGGAVTLQNVTASHVVVSTPLKRELLVTAAEKTNLGTTDVQTNATLSEQSLDVSAGGFADLILTGANTPKLTLNGSIWQADVQKPAIMQTSSASSIHTLIANAKVQVLGTGSILEAQLNAPGCELAMQPGTLTLASGVDAIIAGERTQSQNTLMITPKELTFDVASIDNKRNYIELTLSGDAKKITKITNGDKVLTDGTDYRPQANGIRLYHSYLSTLKEGKHTLVITLSDGSRGQCLLTIQNSLTNALDVTSLTFDKYQKSAAYTNLPVVLSLARGASFQDITLGGLTLERGKDYTFNSATKTVIFERDALAKRSNGVFQVVFRVSSGNNPVLSLTIEDSSPKNEITPTSIDFDANPASGGYQDMRVTLRRVEGATLTRILAGNRTLEENWQYKLSGDEVLLSKSALSDLAPSRSVGFIDLTFDMSTGVDPVLRVHYVTTHAVKIVVADELGKPLANIPVSVSPNGTTSEGESPAQTVQTNAEGIAVAYVKPGGYTITAQSDRFAEPLTRSIRVAGNQTVHFTPAILETVSLYITDANGANLSGATVTLGGKTVTTEATGVATFQIKRGEYTARVVYAGFAAQNQTISVQGPVSQRIILK